MPNIYPFVSLALDIPEAMTNIGFTFRGLMANNYPKTNGPSDNPLPFNVYANDQLVYEEKEGLPASTWFEVPIPAELLRPGLNSLKIRNMATKEYVKDKYDIDMSSDAFILFRSYEVKYEKPPSVPKGLLLIVR